MRITDESKAILLENTSLNDFQILLCVFHLGFITAFLSDAFISGYTTATALFVLTSQIPDIFGLTLKRYYGPFNIVYVSYFHSHVSEIRLRRLP